VNYATQEKIRRNLYNGKINVSQITNDERSLYEKIIKRHMTELNQIIVQKYSIFNVSFVKGIFLALCSYICGDLFYTDVYYPWVIVPAQEVGWGHMILIIMNGFIYGWRVGGLSNIVVISPLILALILGCLAYKSFYKAWHIKEKALNDLLRDEAMLVKLENIK